jgi:rod shape-determining protein MreC
VVPPSNRRPGYSRKAQYSLFAAYVLAVGGAVFAGLMLIISIADPVGFSVLRSMGSEVTAPVSNFFGSIRNTITDAASNTSAYVDAGSKNAALIKEAQANRTKLIEAKAISLENRRLRQLLGLKQYETGYIAIGRLLSSTASSSRRIATLSVGSSSGLLTGQPVRGPTGLIGRVIETSPNTSRILLITDANSPVPVMRAIDGMAAIGEGLSNGLVAVRPVNLGINPFKRGDIIVTSGNGGLFHPNIPYAKVIRKTDFGAIAMPLADPSTSPNVMVLSIYEAPATKLLDSAQSKAAEEAPQE